MEIRGIINIKVAAVWTVAVVGVCRQAGRQAINQSDKIFLITNY